MDKKILDIENLFIKFHTDDGTVDAVNGVNLSINEGET